MSKIDFVILWVDGSDINWINEKRKYDNTILDAASSAARFRDWDNLQYWFRGVEKFAPWVNNIFFITWGHLPKWLNINHPKLKIVNHKDFIPAEYLPTFNSNAIELNLHRIKELSENFVLFNDDTFVIKTVTNEDFFKNGKPVDEFVLNTIVPRYDIPIISHTCVNNLRIINKYFKKRSVVRKNFAKIYNFKYGTGLLRTCLLSPWGAFPGFRNTHIPLAHLKSTFELLWDKEFDELNQTCSNKFRQYNDLNHWVMRYWNLCSGKFVPRQTGFGKLFTVSNDNSSIIEYVIRQKGKTVCINDIITEFDFNRAVFEIKNAFDKILSDKSSFEI